MQDSRGKNILQYCEWNNTKLKYCANNNRYDQETIERELHHERIKRKKD